MKTLLILAVSLVATATLAQTATPTDMPAKMLSTNWKEWQLDGITILFLLGVLGRGASALKAGGGIVGMVKGVLFGTNTPATPTEPKP